MRFCGYRSQSSITNLPSCMHLHLNGLIPAQCSLSSVCVPDRSFQSSVKVRCNGPTCIFGNKAESGSMKALSGSLVSLLQRTDSAYFEQWGRVIHQASCAFKKQWSLPNDIILKNSTKSEYGKVRIITVFDNDALRVLSLRAYVDGQAMRRTGIVQRLISTKMWSDGRSVRNKNYAQGSFAR